MQIFLHFFAFFLHFFTINQISTRYQPDINNIYAKVHPSPRRYHPITTPRPTPCLRGVSPCGPPLLRKPHRRAERGNTTASGVPFYSPPPWLGRRISALRALIAGPLWLPFYGFFRLASLAGLSAAFRDCALCLRELAYKLLVRSLYAPVLVHSIPKKKSLLSETPFFYSE